VNVTIRDELDAINRGFGEAFATQDAARLAAFYADDARLLFHGRPIIRGRAAIDAEFRDAVSGGPATLRFVSDEVIADGSLVVDVGRIVGPTGQSKYVCIYQRQPDGSLRMLVDAANRDGPPSTPTTD
jgi:ketosteroid isomerase-like protein